MKRVLIVSYAFPPLRAAESPQAWRLARGLAGHGWEPTVVTVMPWTSRDAREAEVPPCGFEVVRVPSCEPRLLLGLCWRFYRPLLAVPDEKRLWALLAGAAAMRLLRAGRGDVVHTRSCPLSGHLVGLALKRRTGVPWVAHFSDPWTTSPYFPRRAPWQVKYNERLEGEVIRAADALTFTNAHALNEALALHGREAKAKAAVVPHATDLERRPAAQPPAAGGPLRLLHAGSLYGLRTGRALYEAVAAIERVHPGAVRLTLLGPMEAAERAVVERRAPPGAVQVEAAVDTTTALARMAEADVLVCIDAPCARASPFLPSKLYDYLMAGRPILALAPERGATADFIASAGGIRVSPEDAAGLRAVLHGMIARRLRGEPPAAAPDPSFARAQDVGPASGRLARVLEGALAARLRAARGQAAGLPPRHLIGGRRPV